MSQCMTTSGPHRCQRELGHDGPCECDAPEYATTLDARLVKLERLVATQAAQIASLQMAMPRGIP